MQEISEFEQDYKEAVSEGTALLSDEPCQLPPADVAEACGEAWTRPPEAKGGARDEQTLTDEQRQSVGEVLFAQVCAMGRVPDPAKITGMLLDMPAADLHELLRAPTALAAAVDDAQASLSAWQSSTRTNEPVAACAAGVAAPHALPPGIPLEAVPTIRPVCPSSTDPLSTHAPAATAAAVVHDWPPGLAPPTASAPPAACAPSAASVLPESLPPGLAAADFRGEPAAAPAAAATAASSSGSDEDSESELSWGDSGEDSEDEAGGRRRLRLRKAKEEELDDQVGQAVEYSDCSGSDDEGQWEDEQREGGAEGGWGADDEPEPQLTQGAALDELVAEAHSTGAADERLDVGIAARAGARGGSTSEQRGPLMLTGALAINGLTPAMLAARAQSITNADMESYPESQVRAMYASPIARCARDASAESCGILRSLATPGSDAAG